MLSKNYSSNNILSSKKSVTEVFQIVKTQIFEVICSIKNIEKKVSWSIYFKKQTEPPD